MLIKRFEAGTMADALAQVKQELGPDAIVLGTRTRRRDRGVFGLLGNLESLRGLLNELTDLGQLSF